MRFKLPSTRSRGENHGNRQADQTTLSSSCQATSHGPGAITPANQSQLNAIAHQYAFYNTAQQAASRNNSVLNQMVPGLAGAGAFMQPNPLAALVGAGAISAEASPPVHLEREMTVGEIVGWRIWKVRVDDCLLASYGVDRIWLPGETMVGKPTDGGWEGVWAFKERDLALMKAARENAIVAVGSVYLWGETIEHEIGYRGEFAEVRSIDRIVSELPTIYGFLEKLRERYKVGVAEGR